MKKSIRKRRSNRRTDIAINERIQSKHELITFIKRDPNDYRRGYFYCKKHGQIEDSKLIDHSINKETNPCKKCVSINKKKPRIFTDKFIQNRLDKNGHGIIYLKRRDKNDSRKGYFFCSKHGEIIKSKNFSYQIRTKNPLTCCPECKKEKQIKDRMLDAKEIQRRSDNLFGHFRFLRHDSQDVRYGYFLCLKHLGKGEQRQNISNHFKGNNPCCAKASKNEEKTRKMLLKLNLNFTTRKIFGDCRNKLPLPFDFYIKKLNLLIEFDGIQHYQPVSFFDRIDTLLCRKKRDVIKNEYAKNNGFNFIRIPYTKEEKISIIIFKAIRLINSGERVFKIYSV